MYSLVRHEIDVQSLRNCLLQPEDGAVAIFEGVVRDHAHGRRVRFLEYHAYESMALKKLEEIGEQAKAKFAIRNLGIIHRLGRLEVGECSVAIIVASEHREPAFDACRFAIDNLKTRVPIWKKEFYEDDEVWIQGGS